MITAPLVQRVDSHGSSRAKKAPQVRDDPGQYAASRLENTVWDRAPAVAVYRGMIRFGTWLAGHGASADALTFGSVVLAAVAAVAAGTGHFFIAALAVLISGAADALDGAVARAARTSSRYGALLDSTVDRLSDGLPLLGVAVFYAGTGALSAIPAAAMLAAFLVSYVRARAESLGASLPPLFMRRAERVVLMILALLLAPIEIPGLPVHAPLLLLGVAGIGLMSFAGAILALRSARVALGDPRAPSITSPSE